MYITDIFSLGNKTSHIERKWNICLKSNKAIKQDLCVDWIKRETRTGINFRIRFMDKMFFKNVSFFFFFFFFLVFFYQNSLSITKTGVEDVVLYNMVYV